VSNGSELVLGKSKRSNSPVLTALTKSHLCKVRKIVFEILNVPVLTGKNKCKGVIRMKPTTTSWIVTGLGAAVTGVGATMLSGTMLGAGVVGFGLAHVALGVLDMVRPSIRR